MDFLYSGLVLLVWFMSTFFVVLMMLIVFEKKEAIYLTEEYPGPLPRVSVILPAYNEEEGILPALDSLAAVDYPRELYEVIVVNDGSSDRTADRIRDFIDSHKGLNVVLIDRKENKGKAYGLNEGINASSGEFIACMDGDSIVRPDILLKTVGYFRDPKTASVSVRVDVRNPRKLLERIVDVEYSVGLSTSLKALSFLGVMHVTPGPFSIYRKSVLLEIGGFDETNITEDLEIAFRLQKMGYRMVFCLSTAVSTTVPSDIKALYKQRNRWYSGSLITLWQHKDLFFKKGAGLFQGFLIFNYSLIFLGLGLFVYSLYIYSSIIYNTLRYLLLIDFDVFSYPIALGFDPLSIDVFTALAFTMVLMTLVLAFVSSGILKKSFRNNMSGVFGYIFFFVFYQIFWLNSVYNFVRRRQIKWR